MLGIEQGRLAPLTRIKTDILFQIKRWVEEVERALKRGSIPPSSESLLARFDASGLIHKVSVEIKIDSIMAITRITRAGQVEQIWARARRYVVSLRTN